MKKESIEKVLCVFMVKPKEIHMRIVDLLLSNPRPKGIPMSFIIDNLLVNLVGSTREKLDRALNSLNTWGVIRWVVVNGNSSVKLTSAAWKECAKEEPQYYTMFLASEVESAYDAFSDIIDTDAGKIMKESANKIADVLSAVAEKIREEIKK